MKTIGERIFAYRARERINQTEMARRCGVSLQTICSVENGIQKPSKMTRAKILLVIGEEEEE